MINVFDPFCFYTVREKEVDNARGIETRDKLGRVEKRVFKSL